MSLGDDESEIADSAPLAAAADFAVDTYDSVVCGYFARFIVWTIVVFVKYGQSPILIYEAEIGYCTTVVSAANNCLDRRVCDFNCLNSTQVCMFDISIEHGALDPTSKDELDSSKNAIRFSFCLDRYQLQGSIEAKLLTFLF